MRKIRRKRDFFNDKSIFLVDKFYILFVVIIHIVRYTQALRSGDYEAWKRIVFMLRSM